MDFKDSIKQLADRIVSSKDVISQFAFLRAGSGLPRKRYSVTGCPFPAFAAMFKSSGAFAVWMLSL